MSAVVKIDFRIGGSDAVARAFKTITQAAEASARSEVKAAQKTSERVAKIRNDSATEAVKAADKAVAADKAGADKSIAIARRKQQALGASMTADIRATETAAKRKETIEAASYRRRELAHASRLNAGFREEERAAKRSATLATRQEARAAKQSTAATRGFFNETGTGAGRGLRSGVGMLAAGGGLVAGAIGTGGIVAAVQSRMDLESQAAQLAADVRTGDDKFIDRGALIRDAQRVAGATGIKSEDVMGAMSTASGEGGGMAGLDAFRANLDKMGEFAMATGSTMGDLAKVSATMTNNGIVDPTAQLAGFRSINAAAKKGNLNFRDMAPNVMEVAGKHTAMGFEGGAERRIALSSGLMQIAKGATGSAAEAATSASSFMADLVGDKSSKFLKSKGKSVYKKDAKGNKVARDVEDLVVDLYKSSKGDPEKLGKIFDIRSKATQAKFNTAYAEKGEAGIHELFREFVKASQSGKQITEEADLQKGTSASQVSVAMEQFKAKVGNELLPVLTKAIPEFAKLATAVSAVVTAFAEAPKATVAKFLALSTALGAAQAAVGNMAGNLGAKLLDKLLGTNVAAMNVTAANVNVVGGVGAGGAAGGALAGAAGGAVGGLRGALASPTLRGIGALGAGALGAAAGATLAAGAGGLGLGYGAARILDQDISADLRKSDTRGLGLQALNQAQDVGSAEKRAAAERTLAALKAEQSKSVLQRFGEGIAAPFREGTGNALMKGADLLQNGALGSTMMGLRAAGTAVYGNQQASGDTTSQDGIKALEAALAKPRPQDDVVAAINGLRDTVAASALQSPKVPTP